MNGDLSFRRALVRAKRARRNGTWKRIESAWDIYNHVARSKYGDRDLTLVPDSDFFIRWNGNSCNIFVFDALWNAGWRYWQSKNGKYPGPLHVFGGLTNLTRIAKPKSPEQGPAWWEIQKGDIFANQKHMGLVKVAPAFQPVRVPPKPFTHKWMFRSIEWWSSLQYKYREVSGFRFYRVK